jgi:hypothetical protein
MAGFGSATFVGEYYGQSIVNKLWYRSAGWTPLSGNPFDDVQSFVDTVDTGITAYLLGCLTANYTLLRIEGVGYDDQFNLVTSSPIVKTKGSHGTDTATDTSGAIITANLGLRCGEQVTINGIGKSKRNRGYLAIGPVPEIDVDNYGHIVPAYQAVVDAFGQACLDTLTDLGAMSSLIPIRLHEKWLTVGPLRTIIFRTYSDVLGYTVPRRMGTRRSRLTEA